MSLLDDLMEDSGVDESQRSMVERRMNGILAAAARMAGRSLIPGEWLERHKPLNGHIIVRNIPIREMYSAFTEYDSESGLVYVGTGDYVEIEYAGGPEKLPADIYLALLALVQGDPKPGVMSEQLYDVGAVTFSEPGHAILGHYGMLFRAFGYPDAIPSTLLSSEVL